MRFIADFHIHSKFSRATSQECEIPKLEKVAQLKGIDVLATGDFTHPEWFKHLKRNLKEDSPGLYKLKNGFGKTRFILTTEISCVYSKKGKVRKIHLVVFAPNLGIVEKLNRRLERVGNLKADGRPIFGLSAKELLKIVLDVSSDCLVVPAHIWTPWFSLLGSRSGFDSIEDCFEELTEYIYALETGLSSDPAMNWRLSALDRYTLISCSDAHSPDNLGREACVFDTNISYPEILEAIKQKDPKRFLFTIEFFPEEGKYHYDGHRECGISLSPKETKKYKGVCPKCARPLTIGVLNRVEQLADREEGFRPKNAIPFKSLVPLKEVLSEVFGVGPKTKTVETQYQHLVKKFGSEFDVLLQKPLSDFQGAVSPEVIEAIRRVREGRVEVVPGYDGEYGKIRIFSDKEKEKTFSEQRTLF